MHELSLSTTILGKELDFYLRIMQGVCAMQPNHSFRRQVVFEGPRDKRLFGVHPALMKPNSPRAQEWKRLHEPLSRQGFYLTATWEVPPDGFGKKAADGQHIEGSGVVDLNAVPGTLRWLDWPDPVNARKMNTRAVIQIENERNLLEIMKSMNHRLWAENVRECYQFVSENVVIEFNRFFHLPNKGGNLIEQVNPVLPPLEDLVLFDGGGEDKWLVTASRLVLNILDQDLLQDGLQELRAFQDLMKDCLDFEEMDRLELDTRVR